MAQGSIFQTFDTDTLREAVRNAIDNIAPRDTPLINLLGTKNTFQIENLGKHKYEWLADTLRVRTGTVDNSGSTGTGTSFTIDDASKLKPGDVIKINSEKIWVGAVNTTTNVISSLVRGWGSTSAADHADASAWTYLFSARLEGAVSDDSPYTNPTRDYNYAQIMHFEIEVTGSEKISPRYADANDMMAYQMAKAIGGRGTSGGDMFIDLNNTFYHGERVERVGKSTAGGMGGYKTFVTTHAKNATTLTGGVLTWDMLMDTLQGQWASGGMPTHLVMNATQKRKLQDLYLGFRQMSSSETSAGFMINKIETDFGTLDIVLDRWAGTDEIYIPQQGTLGWMTLRDWDVTELGTVGDFEEIQIVGEFGFVVINEAANAYIYNLNT